MYWRAAAAEMVSGFLKAPSHNLRYVGIDSLARVVRINAKYAGEHQLAVIDCLEDPDDTLKGKTLELLYKMTKPGNVEVGGRPCAAPCMCGVASIRFDNTQAFRMHIQWCRRR